PADHSFAARRYAVADGDLLEIAAPGCRPTHARRILEESGPDVASEVFCARLVARRQIERIGQAPDGGLVPGAFLLVESEVVGTFARVEEDIDPFPLSALLGRQSFERRIESALRRGVVARGVEGEGLEEWPPDGVGRGPAERTCRGYGLLGPLVLDQVAEQR